MMVVLIRLIDYIVGFTRFLNMLIGYESCWSG
jgi:hypothetical protein